jgi:hypothetical protein
MSATNRQTLFTILFGPIEGNIHSSDEELVKNLEKEEHLVKIEKHCWVLKTKECAAFIRRVENRIANGVGNSFIAIETCGPVRMGVPREINDKLEKMGLEVWNVHQIPN